jgi:hypothetical protein
VLELRRRAGDGTRSVKTLTIAQRFNGPPDSGNGGYVCGALCVASGLDLRVRLAAPPPLDVPMGIEQDAATGVCRLHRGDQLIAVGTPDCLRLDVPSPPAYVSAVWASQHYAGFHDHVFADCFVCGPNRRRGDGLRIFPGQLENGIVASPWLPPDSLDGGDGKVGAEFHWAALDCPGYFALTPGRRKLLLGEMQAHVDRRVHVGEACTVIGWKLGVEGRKHYAGTAIFDEDGELCARARATWIDVDASG